MSTEVTSQYLLGKKEIRSKPFWMLCLIPCLVAMTSSLVAFRQKDLRAALLPLALLFGWTQMGGLCGAAHVNTMWMLRRWGWKLWLKSALAYTMFGFLSSIAIGFALGKVGSLFWGFHRSSLLGIIGILALLFTLREAGLLDFPLIERRCQTNRNWAYSFGWVQASAMWGFHIGVGFSTVITYGGFWLLVALLVALGDPRYGISLMAAYWSGRSLPLFVVSPFSEGLNQGKQWHVRWTYPLLRVAHTAGLAMSTLLIWGSWPW